MAGFFSGATMPDTTGPNLSVPRYCFTKNCRNGIRLSAEDKLCAQCSGPSGSDPLQEYVQPLSLPLPPGASLGETNGGQDQSQSQSQRQQPVAPGQGNTNSYAAHLAMLEERQQNRARKLESETEEVNGRWRTISSATDRADAIDAHKANALPRPHLVDAYRPALSQTRSQQPHDWNLLRQPQVATDPAANVLVLRPAEQMGMRKRQLDLSSAHNDISNKSLKNPSQSTRCGKLLCNNTAISGEDRCLHHYRFEGRSDEDEQRRCASSHCRNPVSDAVEGELCSVCTAVQLGNTKPRICDRLLCTNLAKKGTSLCEFCSNLTDTAPRARKCRTPHCQAVLTDHDHGKYCKLHTGRRCTRPDCNNMIAAKLQGGVCRTCIEGKPPGLPKAKTKAKAKSVNLAKGKPKPPTAMDAPNPRYIAAAGSFSGYQNYPHMMPMPYSYPPMLQFQSDPYQGSQQPNANLFYGQVQRGMVPQPFQEQLQHFQYHGQQLLMQSHPPQQQHAEYPDYSSQSMGYSKQVEHHRSNQELRHDPSLQILSRLSGLPSSQAATFQRLFNETPLLSGPSDSARPSRDQPLRNASGSARRLRVTTMQRMLKVPCSGCLQELGVEEASTHPQVYCVHLPSAVRQGVLLDHEEWKQMCDLGQGTEDGEFDSDTALPEVSGVEAVVVVEQDKEQETHVAAPNDGQQQETRHSSLAPALQQPETQRLSLVTGSESLEKQLSHHATPVDEFPEQSPTQDSVPLHTLVHPEPGEPGSGPADIANETVPDEISGVASHEFAAPPIADGSILGGLPESWAADSIRDLLELAAAAATQPVTPLEVAVALQQELRNTLLTDATEGDSQDGEPSAIGLLRVLDQRVESLRAEPADD